MIPNRPIRSFLVNGIPKSGTLYLARSLSKSLDLNERYDFRIGSRGITESQVQADRLAELANSSRVLQEHLAPTAYNISLLKAFGLTKFVLTLRDPRDVICSLRHHLLRSDARSPWHVSMVEASGLISADFYCSTALEQIDILIEHAFPRLQDWTLRWLKILEDKEFDICLIRYEDFCLDNISAIRNALSFFIGDESVEPMMPKIDRSVPGIDMGTHFRSGVARTFMSEMTLDQIGQVNDLVDIGLFERMDWQL